VRLCTFTEEKPIAVSPDGRRLSVPEGRLIVAQQFTAGDIGEIENIPSPIGTVEGVTRGIFNRPDGTSNVFLCPSDPAINRWAIVKCPSGAKSQSRVKNCV
jgi:hypothetical protein